MLTAFVWVTLLAQSPRPLPEHVQLVPEAATAPKSLAERLRSIRSKFGPSTAMNLAAPALPQHRSLSDAPCSANRTLLVDPQVDPKIATAPPKEPAMPLFRGSEPCSSKLP
jgi:hypothetical protein